MSFETLAILFVVVIAIHNAEEAWLLPDWSAGAGKWHVPVGAFEFHFALCVLTFAAALAAAAAIIGGRESIGAYLVSGYALAMLINVLVPHLAATIALRTYAPGTATALLLNLPVTSALMLKAIGDGYVAPNTFAWAGPAVTLAVALSIPVLFRIGRNLRPHHLHHHSDRPST